MTGYQSKKKVAQAKVEGPLHVVCQCDKCKAQPALDEEGMYLVHHTKRKDDDIQVYKKPWVDLTDEDCKGMSAGDRVVAMWANRILKEKNS